MKEIQFFFWKYCFFKIQQSIIWWGKNCGLVYTDILPQMLCVFWCETGIGFFILSPNTWILKHKKCMSIYKTKQLWRTSHSELWMWVHLKIIVFCCITTCNIFAMHCNLIFWKPWVKKTYDLSTLKWVH